MNNFTVDTPMGRIKIKIRGSEHNDFLTTFTIYTAEGYLNRRQLVGTGFTVTEAYRALMLQFLLSEPMTIPGETVLIPDLPI